MAEFGVALEEFKADPISVLRKCGQQSAPDCIAQGFRPLLPKQALIAKRIQQQWAEAERGSAVTEKRGAQIANTSGSDPLWFRTALAC